VGILAGAQPLAEWMRPLHTTFAEWLNERRDRVGGVFVKGPNTIEYQPEGVRSLIAYVHQNPVRAGIVHDAAGSDWTSHRAYAGTAHKPSWLDVGCGLVLAHAQSSAELAACIDATAVGRKDVDRFRTVPPKPRGRPPQIVTSAPSAEASSSAPP
jgi:hypothetical protein